MRAQSSGRSVRSSQGAVCCLSTVSCHLKQPALISHFVSIEKETLGDEAPKVTSRLIRDDIDPEVYAKAFEVGAICVLSGLKRLNSSKFNQFY